MKKLLAFLFIVVGVVSLFSLTPPDRSHTVRSIADSLAEERQKYVSQVMEAIKGKEKWPADSVFKNIKMLKKLPAERLLGIMNMGWSRSLGVSCNHCHNTDDWASEEKKEKEMTREMAKMTGQINNELLKNIKLNNVRPNVNCTTCHRGQKKPATDLGK